MCIIPNGQKTEGGITCGQKKKSGCINKQLPGLKT